MLRLFVIVLGWLFSLVGLAFAVWLVVRAVKRSEDPARLLFKVILSLLMLAGLFWFVRRTIGGWGGAAIPFACVAFGVAMSFLWAPSIGDVLAKPFTSLFDGGDEPPEPRPLFSTARARRGQGKYLEAVALVREQLGRFPTDVEGQMLLAEIQAQDLNDLPGAEITIHRFCAQPGHAPTNIAFALSTLADWHLKLAQDREAARQDFEKIIELLPDSQFALAAAQRIAHLAGREMLLAPHDRQRIAAAPGMESLGLVKDQDHLKAAEIDPAKLASELLKHLEQHPLDAEARERLAVIYADYYQRLDLASGQLEQLIEQPNQPAKQVVRELNLLADLQIRGGADYETIRQTFQRIIDRYPNLAAAGAARNRIDLLKLELKAKEKSLAVKLGSYDQDIGLKGRS